MRSAVKGLLILYLFLYIPFSLKAQVNGTNLLEYQYGELPGDTSALSGVYDRAVVNYTYDKFKAGISLEQFHSPFSKRNYVKLSQYSLQYTSDPLEVKIGNYYETIGRGILLRSYEIPGAILEDLSYRSRHYFNRDIFGFSTKFRHKGFTAKLLYGKPLNNVFPPSQPDSMRRTDIIESIYADYSFKKQTLGASLLRLTNKNNSASYGMLNATGKISPVLSYYTEFAKNISNYSINDFSDNSPFAYYGSLNMAFNRLGISLEYKNYNNFLLGAGINEPPALVKEHSYKVLNRSTHVLQPLNEQGYQVEMFYTFADFSTLTLNNTMAINKFGRDFIFQEYFIEYSFALPGEHETKVFVDYAEDPFKSEEQRISAGTYIEWKTGKASTVKTEYEFQAFKRLGEKVQNHVLVIGYAYKSKIQANIIGEFSNDSFIVDNNNKIWLGTNLKYQVNRANSVQIFAGQRRGGPACNAGVCYEVLDFKGVELRLTSRF